MALSIVISNATVVLPEGDAPLDIAVDRGVIAAIGRRGIFEGRADRVLDATGMVVVPGGIDPHVHCDWAYEDPRTGAIRQTATSGQVSLAAIHGGTTTLIDFVGPTADGQIAAAAEHKTSEWSTASFCDFSFHVLLTGDIPRRLLEQVPEAVSAGFPSFKVFTTDVRPGITGRKVDFGSLRALLERTAAARGLIAVHAEDDDLVMHAYRELISDGRVDVANMPFVHSSLSEEIAFERVISLARGVEGAILYMMHVSAAAGVRAISRGRETGTAVYGETLPQYALRTQDQYSTPDGRKFHTYPSLKSREDSEALWRGIDRNLISTFATDELCTSYADKVSGDRIDNLVGGNVGIEPRMALLYEEVVCRRGMSLSKYVDLTSTNAAKILGLYPRKGVIAVGSDADLTLLDPGLARRITASELHESDYTPWEGCHVSVWPAATMLRGMVIVEGGECLGRPGYGELVQRTVGSEVTRVAGSVAGP